MYILCRRQGREIISGSKENIKQFWKILLLGNLSIPLSLGHISSTKNVVVDKSSWILWNSKHSIYSYFLNASVLSNSYCTFVSKVVKDIISTSKWSLDVRISHYESPEERTITPFSITSPTPVFKRKVYFT